MKLRSFTLITLATLGLTHGGGGRTIFVNDPSSDDAPVAVDVPVDGKVADLSREYARLMGKAGSCPLMFRGETLNSGGTLAEAGIGAEATVMVADVFAQYPGIALSDPSSKSSPHKQ